MRIIEAHGLADDRLDMFARLTDLQLRSRIEPQKAVFIAETGEVIRRVLDAGAMPLAMLTDTAYLPGMDDLLQTLERANPDMDVFTLPRQELKGLTGFNLNRGSLCAFRRPAERTVQQVVEDAHLVAVLEDIRDFTNVGALFRSAAALGVDAVLVTPACYDPLYRRALRVSMGTVFQVPWARVGTNAIDWSRDGVPLLHDLGFVTAAMALSDDAISVKDPRLKSCDKLALVFGTEGDGLAASTISRCDYTVKIPMSHGVDSLNVAASSAVAFWELVREHRG